MQFPTNAIIFREKIIRGRLLSHPTVQCHFIESNYQPPLLAFAYNDLHCGAHNLNTRRCHEHHSHSPISLSLLYFLQTIWRLPNRFIFIHDTIPSHACTTGHLYTTHMFVCKQFICICTDNSNSKLSNYTN